MEGTNHLGQHLVLPVVKYIRNDVGPAYWDGPRMVMLRIKDIISAEEFEPRGQVQSAVTRAGTITKIYIPEDAIGSEAGTKSKSGLLMITVAVSPKQLFDMVGAIVL